MRVKEESEKAGLKLNTQNTKIMSPITSWQIDGEQVETMTDFIILSSKISVDSDCNHEIKTLDPWKQHYDKPRQCIKKQRHNFANKIHIVKAMVFPVIMYGCESWTTKKAQQQQIKAFKLWYWGRLLRVPWTRRRSKQSIPDEINPEYSLEGLMLKLNLQYFGHLMRRANSLVKTLMLGKIEGKRRRGCQRMRWLYSITNSTDINLSKFWEIMEDRGTWQATDHRVTKKSDTT